MVSNSLGGFLPEFAERQQELTTLIRKMSSHIEIAPVEREKFELELRNYHAADADDLARHFKSSVTWGLDTELAQVRLLNGGPNIVKPAKTLPMWAKLLLSLVSGFAPLLWVACFFVFLSWR